jgi:uncharacterized 2Fe-2S/4Fe-4S cluster protein (DUF4445 family)
MDALTDTEIDQGIRLGCMSILHKNAVVRIPNGNQAIQILTSGIARGLPLRPAITKRHFHVPAPTTSDLRSDFKRVCDALGVETNHVDFELTVLRTLGKDLRDAQFDMTAVCANGQPFALEPGDTTGSCYGIALDIGTTTLAAYLIDLRTGRQLAVAAAINPQSRVGDDVISRISYCSQETTGLSNLQSAVSEEFNRLIGVLCDTAKVSSDHVYEVAMVGNTCMAHIFLGIDPSNLAQAPYVPTVSQSVTVKARELGVRISPFGVVYVLPSIAGYVGGDMVGVVLATGIHENSELTLAVDIGTNGEIVLGSKDRMLACSTAAGPAFERAHIKFGMSAAPGAIDAAWLDDGQLKFSTIGGMKAAGICGSGLLDVIICLVGAGIVDCTGRLVAPEEVPEEYSQLRGRLRVGERGNEFILSEEADSSIGEPIVIVQRDIRELQLAKGAISAGIQTLMARLGVSAKDLDKVVLAGAFGNYIRKGSAIASGMLPNVPIAKVHSVGNAAGEGAKMSLISLDARNEAECIAACVEYVELTTDSNFQDRFADALMFGSGSQM